ncbi:MAG: 50S ribosomal protein L21 [Omnitrophica WOR_2 bacterium SM23_29]|nr:MAG: 50S ribosomal protein L21 [Omnitrophica WOR_2 bacterium SM23_29]
MYAIIQTGGKQYKVFKGDTIDVERLGVHKKEITIKDVLLISDGKDITVGRPFIKDAKVICEVLSDFKGKKVLSFKYRRRKNSRWRRGHRQQLTRLRIKEIAV